MISSDAYNFINVLNKAADASWMRNNVISNNLSNVSTPGYKRKDVQFETYLLSQMTGSKSLSQKVANADLNALNGTIYTDDSNLSYRLDGNNVDIDTETAKHAENQLRYYMLMDSMTQEFNRMKAVLAGR